MYNIKHRLNPILGYLRKPRYRFFTVYISVLHKLEVVKTHVTIFYFFNVQAMRLVVAARNSAKPETI